MPKLIQDIEAEIRMEVRDFPKLELVLSEERTLWTPSDRDFVNETLDLIKRCREVNADETVETIEEAPASDKPIVLVDVDGTLADCTHRLHYVTLPCSICNHARDCHPPKSKHSSQCKATGLVCPRDQYKRNKNWQAFFDACGADTPIESVCTWVRNLTPDYEVWIVSGRPMDLCGDATQRWLDMNEIPFDRMFMRPARDTREDSIIKQEILDSFSEDERKRIKFVIDDRKRVCDMWRKNGLTVFQVADGDF